MASIQAAVVVRRGPWQKLVMCGCGRYGRLERKPTASRRVARANSDPLGCPHARIAGLSAEAKQETLWGACRSTGLAPLTLSRYKRNSPEKVAGATEVCARSSAISRTRPMIANGAGGMGGLWLRKRAQISPPSRPSQLSPASDWSLTAY